MVIRVGALLVAIKGLAAAVVWCFANYFYVRYRREGRRGFRRIALFFLGWPLTLVSRIAYREGRRLPPPRELSVDEEEELLREEIRRGRIQAGGGGGDSRDASDPPGAG